MQNDQYNRLLYFPVGAEQKTMTLEHSGSCMLNVVRPQPSTNLDKLSCKIICCDSGGLQIHHALKKDKMVIVGPMLRTIADDPSVFTLGTISNCIEYNRVKSDMAFTIDYPTYCDDSDSEYFDKLSKSRRARDQILRVAPYLCPDTEIVIALQPRNPLEIARYFIWIYTPAVRIYAYPIRNFRNKPKDALGNAYVLSFLSSVGIQQVHFLGSSAPPVIFLLAQAIALDMFSKASFDSRTWDQQAMAGYRYLHPIKLDPVPGRNEKSLHPNTNLITVLRQYNGLFEATIGRFIHSEWAFAEDWLGILNISIIEHFKNMVLSAAFNNELRYFIKDFPKYGEKKKDKIIEALDLLEESKDYGHEHIENEHGSII